MNFYIGISLTILALVAGMYLLAKVKAEALGGLFKLIAWLIVILAGLLIVCQIAQGFMRMCRPHHGMMIEKECIMDGGPMMMHGGGWREECKRMGCDSDDSVECRQYMMGKGKGECCKGTGKEEMEHCKGMMKEKDDDEKADSAKKH